MPIENNGGPMKYFAVSDNRSAKAKKIEAVLCDYLASESIHNKKILDLGCGSGHIAEYFSVHNQVTAADVVDQFLVAPRESLKFCRVAGKGLPFDDGSFDIVIFNHVLFCIRDQIGQLREIRRVLKSGGVCYFASSNRNFPVEGFTKLPLVHYLPGTVFRAYSRWTGISDVDLFPVGYHRILSLIRQTDFIRKEYTVEIMKHPGRYYSEYKGAARIPVPSCMSPTVVFVLQKAG
jgi:ubiquinone/menaquinone biosynthesis C-methylase UbiE